MRLMIAMIVLLVAGLGTNAIAQIKEGDRAYVQSYGVHAGTPTYEAYDRIYDYGNERCCDYDRMLVYQCDPATATLSIAHQFGFGSGLQKFSYSFDVRVGDNFPVLDKNLALWGVAIMIAFDQEKCEGTFLFRGIDFRKIE